MNAPCKGCKKRYIGCHSECKTYRLYLIAHEAEKRATELRREATNMDIEFMRKNKYDR